MICSNKSVPAIIVFNTSIGKHPGGDIAEETQLERDSGLVSGSQSQKKAGISYAWVFALIILLISAGITVYILQMPKTPLQQAEALLKSNRPAAALPILENLAKSAPEDHSYLPWLAQCYLQTDRLAEGRTALDTAIRCKLPTATLVPVVSSFNRYYRQRNDYAEADRLLSKAQTSIPGSSFDAERRDLYREWADYEAQNNKISEAIQHLEASTALGADNDAQMAHRLSELYRQQAAIEEMQNGDDKKAISLLEKSLTVADEPASRMALANLYSKNNDTERAIANLRAVCQSDPNNLEARRRLVESCLKVNDIKGAQEAALELAERERCLENYQTLATLYLRLDNYAGAVRALEEASNLAPKDLSLLRQLQTALADWSSSLIKGGKMDDAQSIKVRADRVTDAIKAIEKELNPNQDETQTASNEAIDTSGPPLSLTASRIWLSKGSLTPEGEIKVRNSTDQPITDLSLNVAFFDSTFKRRTGSVMVSAASESHPLMPGQTSSLYFSSPNIVKTDHQLSVLIYWKGKLIRELPVVKER